jgi:CRISPR/Cas system-associated protein Cas10 (large subunit of type III CRISPR-Cas system)
MKKIYTEDIPERVVKTSIDEFTVKAHTIRCPYNTKMIKTECCICGDPIAGTEESYLMRGNYCPTCNALTAEQNSTRLNKQKK